VQAQYDTDGRLTALVDANGNPIQMTNDVNNLVQTVTDRDGNTVTVTYDTRGNVLETKSPLGEVTASTYDGNDHVLSRTDPLGNTSQFTYDAGGNMLTATDPLGNVTRLTYGPYGEVQTASDPLGNTVTNTFDDQGNLTRLVNPMGDQVSVNYDTSGNLTSITSPAGGTTLLGYDTTGDLTSFQDALGNTKTFTYDTNGDLLTAKSTQTTPQGTRDLVITKSYDADGELISQTNPEGGTTRTEYDAIGNQTAVVDARGNRTTFRYDLDNNVVETDTPDGGSERRTYDAAGNNTAVTDALGNTVSFSYDKDGRLTETIYADNTHKTVQYDADGRVMARVDENGNTATFQYDANGNQTMKQDCGCQGSSGKTFYQYDADQRLTAEVDALGRKTQYVYDDVGQVTETIDAMGGVTRTSYDSMGRPVSVTDTLGNTTTSQYDALGHLTAQTDPVGERTQYSYDESGNVVRTVDPNGVVTQTDYDGMGRPIATHLASGQQSNTVYDASGNVVSTTGFDGTVTRYDYDSQNRLLARHYADGTSETFTYDTDGQLLTETDRAGRRTTYAYDLKGRVASVTDALGDTTTNTYDAAGQLIARTDALGQRTQYDYDSQGHLTSVTDPRGGVVRYTYDDVGNRTTVTDAAGNTTSYTYDDLNRLLTETNQLGATRSYVYDAVGDVVRSTDRDGRVRTFDFDAARRLVAEHWLSGSTVVNTISYQYSAGGQLLSAQDSSSALAYTYDAYGRLTSVDNNGTPGLPDVVLNYSYDTAGREASSNATVNGVTDFTNTYQYDGLSRQTEVAQSGTTGGNAVAEKRVDFAYNPLNQFTGVTRYRDVAGTQLVASSAYSYDSLGRLTGLSHSQGGTPLAQYTWSYDALSRITQMTSADGTDTYSYDTTSELVSATHTAQPNESFSYDLNGNRTNPGYSTGADNQLLSDGTYNYAYDGEGNVVRRTAIASGAVTEYQWDYRNRLIGVTNRDSSGTITSQSTYTYDVENRLISTSTDPDGPGPLPPVITRFVYDGNNVVLAFDGSGQMTDRFLYGPASDQLLADERVQRPLGSSDRVLWPLVDHQGSVRDIVDQLGASVKHVVYSAFGDVVRDSNPTLQFLFLFTGRPYDVASGLYYYRARYYASGLGRFLSEDPHGFPAGDLNLFRYVSNNPLNLNDPSGMEDTNTLTTSMAGQQTGRSLSLGGIMRAFAWAWRSLQVARIFSTYRLILTLAWSRPDSVVILGAMAAGLYWFVSNANTPGGAISPLDDGPVLGPPTELERQGRADAVSRARTLLQIAARAHAVDPDAALARLQDGDENPCDVMALQNNEIVEDHVDRGGDRLVLSVLAKLHKPLNTGTTTNGSSVEMVRRHGYWTDDAGHLLARRLGGSGRVTGTPNLFPQDPRTNRGAYRVHEGTIADAVTRANRDVCVLIVLLIGGDELRPDRAVGVNYSAWGDGVPPRVPFENPPPAPTVPHPPANLEITIPGLVDDEYSGGYAP
jgi:RHS repeat-associated protein